MNLTYLRFLGMVVAVAIVIAGSIVFVSIVPRSSSSGTTSSSTGAVTGISSSLTSTQSGTKSTTGSIQYNCPLLTDIPLNWTGSGFFLSNRYQFVIKPGTAAFLNITYPLGGTFNSSIVNNYTAYFFPITKLDRINVSSVQSISASQAGINIHPINVTMSDSNNHSFSVLYIINASITAPNDSYIIPQLWSTCIFPILTVGDSLYTGVYASDTVRN